MSSRRSHRNVNDEENGEACTRNNIVHGDNHPTPMGNGGDTFNTPQLQGHPMQSTEHRSLLGNIRGQNSYIDDSDAESLGDSSHLDERSSFNQCLIVCGNSLLFIFCVKRNMSKKAKALLVLIWATGLACTAALITTFLIFADNPYTFNPSDMRVLDKKSSTLFCSEWEISAANTEDRYETIIQNGLELLPESLKHEDYCTAYLLPSFPHLRLDKQENDQVKSNGVQLGYNSVYTKSFYLLTSSSINITLNVKTGRVLLLVLASSKSFMKISKELSQCRDASCALVMEEVDQGEQESHIVTVDGQGHYHIIFEAIENKTILDIDIRLKKTVYDKTGAISTCISSGARGSCSFRLKFGSQEVVLVEAPHNLRSAGLDITSSCTPRLSVYLLFFGLPSLVLVMAFALAVPATLGLFLHNTGAQAGRLVDSSSDLLTSNTQLDQETTPLLSRPSLLTYSNTFDHTNQPPPEYQTDAE